MFYLHFNLFLFIFIITSQIPNPFNIQSLIVQNSSPIVQIKISSNKIHLKKKEKRKKTKPLTRLFTTCFLHHMHAFSPHIPLTCRHSHPTYAAMQTPITKATFSHLMKGLQSPKNWGGAITERHAYLKRKRQKGGDWRKKRRVLKKRREERNQSCFFGFFFFFW